MSPVFRGTNGAPRVGAINTNRRRTPDFPFIVRELRTTVFAFIGRRIARTESYVVYVRIRP